MGAGRRFHGPGLAALGTAAVVGTAHVSPVPGWGSPGLGAAGTAPAAPSVLGLRRDLGDWPAAPAAALTRARRLCSRSAGICLPRSLRRHTSPRDVGAGAGAARGSRLPARGTATLAPGTGPPRPLPAITAFLFIRAGKFMPVIPIFVFTPINT